MCSKDFTCSICLLDKDEIPTLIAGDESCRECIEEYIIPKFEAALEHETNYPVEYSGSVRLELKDFAKFFEDYPGFLQRWNEKMREYRLRGEDRLYCRPCGGFLGLKNVCPVFCSSCKVWKCARCGSSSSAYDKDHTCRRGDEDPLNGLTLGKDFQRCPNESCKNPQFLQDGCNSVRCAVCKLAFCYICAKARPSRDHWNAGGCPRFNQPGASNALYNNDVIEATGELENNRQQAARMTTREEFALPALPAFRGQTNLERLLEEENQRVALEATHAGVVMLRDWNRLMEIQLDANRHRARLLAQGATLPLWFDPLSEFILKLLMNLNIYIYRVRLQVGLDHYRRRHQEIPDLVVRRLRFHPEVIRRYPGLLQIWGTYMSVATLRLAEADRAVRAVP